MTTLNQQALDYHEFPRPGKISVESSKPCATALDLSLAYTPGVAEPVREIAKNPENAYRYTNKGNLVAVITDGTAILAESGLSYLGLGVQIPTPSWGQLLQDGQRDLITGAWWMTVFPGIAIFLVVLAFNLMGDGLRDALDPRHRKR